MGSSISSCIEPGPIFALFQAVRHGDLRVIKFRLDMDPELLTYRSLGGGDTVWHLAAEGGSEEVLGELEAHGGQLRSGLSSDVINLQNDRGQTPLIYAAQAGQVAAVVWLLSRGADPWVQDRCGKRSALHYAAMRGRLDCISALLDNAESTRELCRYIEAPSISGLTPLHYAVAMRQPDAVLLLLEKGADLRAVNSVPFASDLVNLPLRSTPLHVAATMRELPCALALLRYYHIHLAGPNFPDPRRRVDALGRTPYRVVVSRINGGLLAELLHPSSDLRALFSREGEPGGEPDMAMGVPRLAALVASVVRQQLLADVEDAEKATLDFRRRNPCCSSPACMAESQLKMLPTSGTRPTTSPSASPSPGPAAATRIHAKWEMTASGPSLRLAGLTCSMTSAEPMQSCGPGCEKPPPSPPLLTTMTTTTTTMTTAPTTTVNQHQNQEQHQHPLDGFYCGPEPRRPRSTQDAHPEARSHRGSRRCSRDQSLLLPPLRMTLLSSSPSGTVPVATMLDRRSYSQGQGRNLDSQSGPHSSPRPSPEANGSLESDRNPDYATAATAAGTSVRMAVPDPDSELLATLVVAEYSITANADASGGRDGGGGGGAAATATRGCCAVRKLSPFIRHSAGYVESVFSRAPLLPLAQCAVCLEDCYSLVAEPCHHRLCGHCARDVILRTPDMPLSCPVCRLVVCQFTSPVC
ncbi:hypothetical protein Vafri_21442 [Volvox africanus]|uniref:RING-type domain-containing protein n=1 Tax=Volvox africanus TaxID=51714 RepID=A0A8J4BUC3_9CHLO|nr:hypothetical protein Vafri_21442 [Volvox africanus]